MKKTAAINGLGRIGKCVARAFLESNSTDLITINSNKLNPETAAYMLQYDSVHGRLPFDISFQNDCIMYRNHTVKILSNAKIDEMKWEESNIVLECTGAFNSHDQAYNHIKNGAKSVIVSAPCIHADHTLILGVSEIPHDLHHKVISIGSCTTNCLANVVKPLHEAFGITSAFMTTVHAYTNDQCLLDSRHSDFRRGRAANSSIIPTSTGAAKMIGDIIPELQGKIDGVAVRVPVQNVSMIDMKFTTENETSVQNINDVMRAAAQKIPHILSVNDMPLVSIDFNHTIQSAVFDATQTKAIDKKLYRVVAWYDNEWGFTQRMIEMYNLINSQ